MPRPRFDNLEQDRRRKLLENAANEFALHGYQGASLNRIITGVGLSKGAFYYYFEDKADLFDTVARFAIDGLVGPNDDAYEFHSLDRESFWPSVEGWFLGLTARMHELPWLAGLGKLFYHPPAVDGVEGLVGTHFDRVREWLASLLRHGRAVGAVRDDMPVELLIRMTIGAMEASDEWFVEHWEELSPARREELAAASIQVARRIVAPAALLVGAEQGAQNV
jgi:AcrR family transcriptional regulator